MAMLTSCGGSSSGGDPEPEGEEIIWRQGAPIRIDNRGPVPKEFIVKDLRVGSGAVLKNGKVATLRYKSFDYATGQRYEDWWDEPFVTGFGKDESLGAWKRGSKA
jgi:hypothetical protein